MRMPRRLLLSEINHIMLRGIGHMDLFIKEGDFQQFLNTLVRFKSQSDVMIPAYCLMDNHIHILLKAPPEEVPLFLKRIEVSYAYYFNGTYGHTGHIFQNRYKSEAINDHDYLYAALKYILLNPEAAGICKWTEYSWSSAHCYLMNIDDRITDAAFVLNMIGGRDAFLNLMTNHNNMSSICFAEPEYNRRVIDDQSAALIVEQIKNADATTIANGVLITRAIIADTPNPMTFK